MSTLATNDSWSLLVTHLPTDETVIIRSSIAKGATSVQARQLALRVIRSRLWARQHGAGRSDRMVADYRVGEDGEPYLVDEALEPGDRIDYTTRT